MKVKGQKANARLVAEDIVERGINQRWEPTGREIEDRYHVMNDGTMRKVKQSARKYASERGLVWGYDTQFGRYRIVPDNDPGTYKRVVTYYHDAWINSGRSLVHTVKGGRDMGYLSQKNADAATELYEQARKRVERFAFEIEGA